ncbi:four-carbon acid sugar kinase family protein [Lichenibacterium minor]|uniref:3-oxo-tetronate kinase n=1 Tax=Lichenibacterium minor TaxID=2316528 RepID=A0A4Q2UER0_9HYPH|nr:3-oxo-tetronate kinase [Lichenibacterium minor]RYC33801.1 four-carbon acid sugar kinase family protein [Lichenibacterium minor]
MSLLLGAVADDYTGASDLAGTLAGAGLRVVQTIGVPPDDLALPEVDAVVVALKSRSVAAGRAVALSLAADAWLRGRGAPHVLFKVCSTFDSTDDGNIGPVTDALAARTGSVPLVCPAFPRNRRTVYRGHLFVGDDRLDESPLKDHPLNPMRDSSLVRTLARQSAKPVGLIPIETVEDGTDAVLARLTSLAAEGCGSAIIDAVLDRHLDVLGRAALAGPLSTGASGLGLGLARAVGPRRPAAAAAAPRPGRGASAPGTLMLAGSCSAATLGQVARAEAAGVPVRHLDVEALMAGGDTGDAVAWARERLPRGPALVATSRSPAEVAALQARFGAAAVSERLEAALAEVAAALAAGLSRLIVAGGETSGAVVDRLGFQAFALGDEIAPGVPLLRAVGARHAGLSLALKSGNFGGIDFFADATRAN